MGIFSQLKISAACQHFDCRKLRCDPYARPKRTEGQMVLAQLFGMAYGAGWGGLGAMYR